MAQKRISKSKITRKTLPQHTRLKLWVKSAGRCEFSGCNRPVWRNDLTLNDGHFGEVAHIIATSEEGPRGSKVSSNLQTEFSNLMLLCQQCHKEVDDNPEIYPEVLLREWKWKHEDRIEIQTSHSEEIYKSTVLVFTVRIKDRMPRINREAYRNAMAPKYPVDDGIKFENEDFDRQGNESYWTAYAKDIERKIKSKFEKGISEEIIKHLSVFAIGPTPLLIFLGKCIGDTVPADLYQRHRNIDDTNQTWSWPAEEQETQISYIVKPIHIVENSNKVALIIALSDTIGKDKYASLVDETFSLYTITVEEPSPHFLRNRKQLEHFSYEYRRLLNQIQAVHGHRCNVFILPAVPVSIAVECGRVLLPTKDPEIFACEYYDCEGFRRVLKLN